MNIAITKGTGGYHLLTNEGLEVGDKVFPLLGGYQTQGRYYVIEVEPSVLNDSTLLACTGWPSDPHTITGFYTEDDGLRYIRTDMGYSPAAVYFKVDTRKGCHATCEKNGD